MEALVEAGVGIEAGVWTVEDAERLGASGLGGRVTRILAEPVEAGAADAVGLVEDIHRALDGLGIAAPRLQHSDGEAAWVLLEDAIRRRLDTRIGLEDTLHGPGSERGPPAQELYLLPFVGRLDAPPARPARHSPPSPSASSPRVGKDATIRS